MLWLKWPEKFGYPNNWIIGVIILKYEQYGFTIKDATGIDQYWAVKTSIDHQPSQLLTGLLPTLVHPYQLDEHFQF